MPRVNSAFGALLAALTVALALLAAGSAAADTTLPKVLVISDSVMTAVAWHQPALDTLDHGFDVDLEDAICRRVADQSCPDNGVRPPTLMDYVSANCPRLPPTVVVEVGYNDPVGVFPGEVEAALQALASCGVEHVLWLDLHVLNQDQVTMNQALNDAAKRHPFLTVIGWDAISHEQWSWFQGDGIHLVLPGALAMAQLVNQALVAVLDPAPPAPPLPPLHVMLEHLPEAKVGHRYDLTLPALGGDGHYRWSVRGRLPKGMHLLADGRLYGRPQRAGVYRLPLTVLSAGQQTTSALYLDVDPDRPDA